MQCGLLSPSLFPPIVLIYVDDNVKTRADTSNNSYFGPQKSLPKTLKVQLDQTKNNSTHPAVMLNPKRSKFAEKKKGGHNSFHNGSSHDHNSLEVYYSSSVELSSTHQKSMILVYFRGRNVLVMLETFEMALVNIPNHHITNFVFSFLKQIIKMFSTFLPYRNIKGLHISKTLKTFCNNKLRTI